MFLGPPPAKYSMDVHDHEVSLTKTSVSDPIYIWIRTRVTSVKIYILKAEGPLLKAESFLKERLKIDSKRKFAFFVLFYIIFYVNLNLDSVFITSITLGQNTYLHSAKGPKLDLSLNKYSKHCEQLVTFYLECAVDIC